jgi:hypothetical protein
MLDQIMIFERCAQTPKRLILATTLIRMLAKSRALLLSLVCYAVQTQPENATDRAPADHADQKDSGNTTNCYMFGLGHRVFSV